MKEGLFYKNAKEGIIKCMLCPHYCHIHQGRVGACGVRKNINGKLYSLVYGKVIASHVDPIEKKPLFHFMPGSRIYSYATAGCNFRCLFCQNWDISQISKGEKGEIIGEMKTPEEIVREAIASGCSSIAATYTEPTIQFEYAFDVFRLAKKKGLYTVFVSNGYTCKGPIQMISPYLDAINIDIKSFNYNFYKKLCGARLKPVLDSVKYYHTKKVWVEITTLVIPGENDSEEELRQIAEFIASVDMNMPWHISRFHPDYKMNDRKFTPAETLEMAYEIGKKAGLRYIYIGNIFGHDKENTYCHNCGAPLIIREGFTIIEYNLKNGKCSACSSIIPGFFNNE